MRFDLEHSRESVEESREAIDASRSQVDALSAAKDELRDCLEDASMDHLDMKVQTSVDTRLAKAQSDIDERISIELNTLKSIECGLQREADAIERAHETARETKTNIERNGLQNGRQVLLDELDDYEERIDAVHTDILEALHEVNGLLNEFSSVSLDGAFYNPDGERRRKALEQLTDAVDALNDLEGYVLKDAEGDLLAARHRDAIPVTGDTAFDTSLRAYVSERINVFDAESLIEDTRFDSMREHIEATSESLDVMGGLTTGVLSASASILLLSSRVKGHSACAGGR